MKTSLLSTQHTYQRRTKQRDANWYGIGAAIIVVVALVTTAMALFSH